MNETHSQQVIADVTSGKYRGAYLVYARKSTDEPESQKNSIAYQKAENVRFAEREHLPIAPVTLPGFCTDGVISERHSAFKEVADLEFGEDGSVRYRVERPKFHRLAAFLSERRFKGVVFLCWDRASRNKGDELILRKLMKAGVDVRFVLATYDDTSAGELHKDIDGMFAEHHSRVTREKVTAVMRASRAKGLCTHRAPVGYLNTGSMEHKPVDPERGYLIGRLFEQADQTEWSLSDLQRWIIGLGFTMPPMRRPRTAEEMLADEERDERTTLEKVSRLPSVTQIHLILTNPFYTGKVPGNDGQWVKSTSHEPLVSEAVFNRVQQKLARRRTSIHYDKKLPLPFRGLLRCACGRVYTPYQQKGLVYFGARCDRSCPNSRKSVNLTFVEEAVAKVLQGLVFTDEELARIDAAVERGAAELEARQAAAHDATERRARKLREDLSYLADNRTTLLRTGAFTPEALVAEEARLSRELERIEEPTTVSADELRETAAAAFRLSELLKTAQPSYQSAKSEKKEQFARLVLSELTLSENSEDFRCARGFQLLDRRFFLESALTDWLSEGITDSDEIGDTLDRFRKLIHSAERPDVP